MTNELPSPWYDFFSASTMRITPLPMTQPMDQFYNSLSLQGKADLIQKKGNFIEGEDFYSFKILLYTFEQHQVEITYDYSGSLISVEFVEEKPSRHGDQLPSNLDGILEDSADS
jgi:hypothetical protein